LSSNLSSEGFSLKKGTIARLNLAVCDLLHPKVELTALLTDAVIEDLLQLRTTGFGPVQSSVYITTCPQLAKAAMRAADDGAGFDPERPSP
jgi:hypothetical protein